MCMPVSATTFEKQWSLSFLFLYQSIKLFFFVEKYLKDKRVQLLWRGVSLHQKEHWGNSFKLKEANRTCYLVINDVCFQIKLEIIDKRLNINLFGVIGLIQILG